MNENINKPNVYERLFRTSMGKLKENIRTIDEIIKILQGRYEINPYDDIEFTNVVIENMIKKYGNDEDYIDTNDIVTFELKFEGVSYYVGFNRKNNGFYVDGNEDLRIQLVLLRGLNKNELSNIFLVGEYLYLKEEAFAI